MLSWSGPRSRARASPAPASFLDDVVERHLRRRTSSCCTVWHVQPGSTCSFSACEPGSTSVTSRCVRANEKVTFERLSRSADWSAPDVLGRADRRAVDAAEGCEPHAAVLADGGRRHHDGRRALVGGLLREDEAENAAVVGRVVVIADHVLPRARHPSWSLILIGSPFLIGKPDRVVAGLELWKPSPIASTISSLHDRAVHARDRAPQHLPGRVPARSHDVDGVHEPSKLSSGRRASVGVFSPSRSLLARSRTPCSRSAPAAGA